MPDTSIRLDLLSILWKRGFPTTVMTPTGLMPAVIVWVDTPDHPMLAVLARAFGGHLFLEMQNHHGEPSPAFWIGVGRSAVLPAGVIRRATDISSAIRTGHGGGLALAIDSAELLGGSARDAWLMMDELARLVMRRERGEEPPSRTAVQREADLLNSFVEGALSIAPHIASGLATAMTGLFRTSGFATNLALPSHREQQAWVTAFMRPLLNGEMDTGS